MKYEIVYVYEWKGKYKRAMNNVRIICRDIRFL